MFLIISSMKDAGIDKFTNHNINILKVMGYTDSNIELVYLNKLKENETSIVNEFKETHDITKEEDISKEFIKFMLDYSQNDKSTVYVIIGESEIYKNDIDILKLLMRGDIAVNILYGLTKSNDKKDVIKYCRNKYFTNKSEVTRNYDEFEEFMHKIKEIGLPVNITYLDAENVFGNVGNMVTC